MNILPSDTKEVMTQYSCICCDKKFHFKEFYDNHRVACEFFSQNRRKRIQTMEINEKIPSQEEMFRLLQHLSLKCQILTEEVDKVKKTSSISRKKSTESLLETLKPKVTFDEWVASFDVKDDCIQEICNKNLTDAIIKCIQDSFVDENNVAPIRSFKENPGIIFIYQEDEQNQLHKWIVCSNEKLSSMIEIIKHEISKVYCVWREKQNDIDIDLEMMYLVKISGLKNNKNKQLHEVKSSIIAYYSK